MRLRKTYYLLSVSKEEKWKKPSSLGPSFPWLTSLQSISQAQSTAVGEEAVEPALSWCQDTTPRPRRSSILCIARGPGLGACGKEAERHTSVHMHSPLLVRRLWSSHHLQAFPPCNYLNSHQNIAVLYASLPGLCSIAVQTLCFWAEDFRVGFSQEWLKCNGVIFCLGRRLRSLTYTKKHYLPGRAEWNSNHAKWLSQHYRDLNCKFADWLNVEEELSVTISKFLS